MIDFVGTSPSWGSWLEAKISLFMVFVYVFTLFTRLSFMFLNKPVNSFPIPPLNERLIKLYH